MGSDDKAVITGFICRLCSRMNRFVVHIYGDEGIQMQLAQKINIYLPITVNPNDPLPKTVCISCIDSLEAQHELMEQFKWARRVQSVSRNEATEDCGGRHSPRPPDEFRRHQMSSVLFRTTGPIRTVRTTIDSPRNRNAPPSSSGNPVMSSSNGHENNPSIPQPP